MRKEKIIALAALLILGIIGVSFVPSVGAYTITVDGDPSDWQADTSCQANNTGQYYSPFEYVWKDAEDDDVGDGNYLYPHNVELNPGGANETVDLLEFRITTDTSKIYFLIKLADVENPFGSGEGFSGIIVTIHIDQDQVSNSGQEWTKGIDAKLDPSSWFEYVVVLTGWSYLQDSSWATVAWTGSGMAVAANTTNEVIEASVDYAVVGDPSNQTWRFIVSVGFEEFGSYREVNEFACDWSPGGGVPTGANDWVEPDAYDGAFYASTADQIADWSDYNDTAGTPATLGNTGQGFEDITFTPEYDANHDGIVDIVDIVLGINAFGSVPCDPNWNPAVDLNGDNLIDIRDLVAMAIHFGETFP
ncbi:MAG: glucodextranase DOMON-like domain-containing protein [Candidatus Bathyarchaeia archaeon]